MEPVVADPRSGRTCPCGERPRPPEVLCQHVAKGRARQVSPDKPIGGTRFASTSLRRALVTCGPIVESSLPGSLRLPQLTLPSDLAPSLLVLSHLSQQETTT